MPTQRNTHLNGPQKNPKTRKQMHALTNQLTLFHEVDQPLPIPLFFAVHARTERVAYASVPLPSIGR